MSWTHDSGGTVTSGSAVTSVSVVVGSAVAAAETICVAYALDNAAGATGGSVTDNLGNSYSRPTAATATDSPNNVILQGQFSIVTATGTPTVKVQFTPTPGTTTSAQTSAAVDTLTGSDASSTNDTTGAGQHQAAPTTSTDALTSGSFTTGTDGDLIFSATLDSATGNNPGSVGTGYTAGQTTGIGVLKTEWKTQTTHGAVAGTWTALTNDDHVTIAFAVKPAASGPVSKTDTDTATLTEQVPQITPTAQTDAFSFAETQTVTPSSAVSKSDTDTATLTETVSGPQLQVGETATLTESALTLLVTDVQAVPDFTVTEQTPQIGLSQTEPLAFSEIETRTASFIRWVDTDAFGLAEATPQIAFAVTDTFSVAERLPAVVLGTQQDSAGLTDAQTVAAFLQDLEAESLTDSQTLTIIGGFTGYAKGLLAVRDRMGGTLTGTARLAGTLGAQDRLRGITTVAPVGPP